MNTKILAGFGIAICFLFYSCKKDTVVLAEPSFDLTYYFYNNGDTSLKKVVVYCSTYYPTEKVVYWQNTGKWRNAFPNDKEHLLRDFDSIIIVPDKQVYQNCNYSYSVILTFSNSNGGNYSKTFTKNDTINSQYDAMVKFIWPTDTLGFVVTN